MRIGKKTIHDVTIGLAMALPILYLCGTMIAGLCGAHGEEIFKEEESVYTQEDYDYLMQPEHFSYDAFEWKNENFTRLGFSLGFIYSSNYNFSYYFQASYTGLGLYYFNDDSNDFVYNKGLGFAEPSFNSGVPYLTVGLKSYSFVLDEHYELPVGVYLFPFYVYSASNPQAVTTVLSWFSLYEDNTTDFEVEMFGAEYSDVSWEWQVQTDFDWYGWDDSLWYFDDGKNLPSWCEFSPLLESYFVPSVKVQENTASYSDNIFGNFFPRNNFVERIGENALSDNPKGFAPFGTMLSYLDDNIFHAGDSQTALMVYGMVYWSLHVIIADLVYHVLVFVPNLINKVFDWFGQRGLNDD